MTLNQIIQILNKFQSNHNQLNSFGRGLVEEIGATKDLIYPIMWVVNYDGQYSSKDMQYNFQIIFADLLTEDKSNELEAQSDMQSVALDLCAYLRDNPDFDFQVDDNASISHFTERFGDFAAGVLCGFNLRDPYALNRCVIPFS